jgi:hypothetical protein
MKEQAALHADLLLELLKSEDGRDIFRRNFG